MEKKTNRLGFPGMTPEKLQFGCLAAVGIMELLLVAFGPVLNYFPYFVVENFSAVPGLIFLGTALMCQQSPLAKRNLLAGVAAVLWLLVAQSLQYMGGEEQENMGMHWVAYLLVFPFAAVVKDRSKGLKVIAAGAILGAILLTLYAGLLKLDMLPAALDGSVYWDGARLSALWHPNITACTLMVGIAFCLTFYFCAGKRWVKGLFLAAAVLQFTAISLTNSRTNILMTCALVAGVVFFRIFRSGWKKFLLGGLVAVIVFGGLFLVSDALYDAHHDRLLAEYTMEQDMAAGDASKEISYDDQLGAEYVAEQDATVGNASEGTAEVKLPTQSGQGSLLNDLKTLNGRTTIWRCALRAVRQNPRILLTGTSYVGNAISSMEGAFEVEHAHNSWMQMLVGFGLPGLLLALYFTFLALRGAIFLLLRTASEMWKKCVALLVLCLLMAGFLEPFLFTGYIFYHFINIIFFLCTGYVDLWREEVVHPERAC